MSAGQRPRFTFTWNEEPVTPQPCAYAEQFQHWCDDLGAQLILGGNVVTLNQAKVLVTDRYFEWRARVPKKHRDYTGNGHICIYHTYVEMYDKIKSAELAITPPMLFLPEEVREEELERVIEPTIHGITIGEIQS